MQDEAMSIFGNLRVCSTLLHRGGGGQRHCRGGFHGRGRVLALLREHDGIGQGELAELLGIRAPSASELIERLAAEELVEKRVNEADRRSVKVFLTEKGGKLADFVGRNRRQEAGELLEGFSGEEKMQLARLLEKLALAMKERTGAAGGEGGFAHGHFHGGGCCGGGHGHGAGHGHGHCHATGGCHAHAGQDEDGLHGGHCCGRGHGRHGEEGV